MEILSCGKAPTSVAPEARFTGLVMQTQISNPDAADRPRCTLVTFAPGGRTNWHTHPKGQTLAITSGSGCVQSWGQPIRFVNAGDVVWFEPGEKHWHGARPDSTMTHVAIAETDAEGEYADWMEPVTEDQLP